MLIKDNTKVNQTIKQIKEKGHQNLHILADFDKTLTQSNYKGKKRPSIISVLRDEGYLGEEYSQLAHNLYNRYNPIESDPNIHLELKKEKMKEWWETHLKLLVESKLNKNDIDKIVNSGKIQLRKGIKQFLITLNTYNIPLIIISANGLGGDSIKLYLKKQNLLFPNIYIVSNNLIFDDEGYATGYDNKIIHVLNKDETIIKDFPEIYNKIKNRKNVILLGDSTGDVGMINGFEYENLLKIGFFCKDDETLKKQYQELYDIVSIDDKNAEFLNEIIDNIITPY